jgi:hypothetical protein
LAEERETLLIVPRQKVFKIEFEKKCADSAHGCGNFPFHIIKKLNKGEAIWLSALREIDRIITQLSECRSKAEFVDLRKKVFSDYVNLSYILANSFSIPNDRLIRHAAIQQSFKMIERLFETEGAPRVGVDVVREATFCIETLRRAYRLVDVIYVRGDAAENVQESDRKLAANFSSSALWAQLHLDCLRLVITRRLGLDQEILDEILQGLRLAVMAYSFARQGVELRTKRDPYLVDATQDAEDRELLEESFRDCEPSLDAES